jgi:hypothetical protein
MESMDKSGGDKNRFQSELDIDILPQIGWGLINKLE